MRHPFSSGKNTLGLIAMFIMHASCADTTNSSARTSTLTDNTTSTTIINTTQGAITVSSDGIGSTGSNATIQNQGSISITGPYSYGIRSSGASATIYNTGTISLSEQFTNGISSLGADAAIYNIGSITSLQQNGFGISLTGARSIINNTGIISTQGNSGYGIYSVTGVDKKIYNAGSISTQGITAHGIYSTSAAATIQNTGSVVTTGNNSNSLYSSGASAIITNNATVGTIGNGSHGVYVSNTGSVIYNNGSISTTGSSSHGLYIAGSSNRVENTGAIRSSGDDANAILVGGDNNTVTLQKGSIVSGEIATTGNNNTLNFNVGPGASYAYSATGAWIVQDLNDRPVVTGSAYAAGIGAQETAAEILHERTRSMTNAIDRNMRYRALKQSDSFAHWIDIYDGDVTRDKGSANSVRTEFTSSNQGMIVGARIKKASITRLEAIMNYEHNSLDIDQGNQRIKTDSIMLGIIAPQLIAQEGFILSGKLLAGLGSHQGDRTVLTNSLNYHGTQNVTSRYSSVYGVGGLQLTKFKILSNHIFGDILLGSDLAGQSVNSYAESAYFSWKRRSLLQSQNRLEMGLNAHYFNDQLEIFGRVGIEYWNLLSGKAQDYTINGTAVSFSGGKTSDTALTLQLGGGYLIGRGINVFAAVSDARSSEKVKHFQANFGVRAEF